MDNFIKAFDSKLLYDDSGDLKEKASDQVLHKRVMNNIIGGSIDAINRTLMRRRNK